MQGSFNQCFEKVVIHKTRKDNMQRYRAYTFFSPFFCLKIRTFGENRRRWPVLLRTYRWRWFPLPTYSRTRKFNTINLQLANESLDGTTSKASTFYPFTFFIFLGTLLNIRIFIGWQNRVLSWWSRNGSQQNTKCWPLFFIFWLSGFKNVHQLENWIFSREMFTFLVRKINTPPPPRNVALARSQALCYFHKRSSLLRYAAFSPSYSRKLPKIMTSVLCSLLFFYFFIF